MVYLLNREISFDVDLSTVGCGLNAAFFFVGMDSDGGLILKMFFSIKYHWIDFTTGKAKYGYKGPVYGTGYCDAQLAQVNKPNCYELDVIESNSLTTLLATHTCKGANNCEPTGCGYIPYPLGKRNFYGRGSSFSVDTTKPFTITTRFVTADGKDTGNLKEIQRIYKQNGKIIPNPTVKKFYFHLNTNFDSSMCFYRQVAGNFSSLSDAYCSYYKLNNLGGISASMTQGLKNGMVLTMGLWGDMKNPDFMGWLDKPPNGPCPVYSNLNPYVTYSNIKYGPIGSTAWLPNHDLTLVGQLYSALNFLSTCFWSINWLIIEIKCIPLPDCNYLLKT